MPSNDQEFVDGILGIQCGGHHCPFLLLQVLVRDFIHEFSFCPDKGVQGFLGDPQGFGDIIHRNIPDPVFQKQVPRAIHYVIQVRHVAKLGKLNTGNY